MTKEELIRNLKYTLYWHNMKKHENDTVSTFGTNISLMCKDVLNYLEQDPCEMTTEEYRQRMIQAFHNADCDELLAICVRPMEKEFEHLEWLLKNHYKKEHCNDVLDKIRTDITEVYNDRPYDYNHSQRTELFCKVMKIIDKYKEEGGI